MCFCHSIRFCRCSISVFMCGVMSQWYSQGLNCSERVKATFWLTAELMRSAHWLMNKRRSTLLLTPSLWNSFLAIWSYLSLKVKLIHCRMSSERMVPVNSW